MSEVITTTGHTIDSVLLKNYFHNLVNHFFKILPMREKEESSLLVYMQSLQAELFGCENLIPELSNNSLYLTLLSILQYLIDNPGCIQSEVKREVFKAISICNKLKATYCGSEVQL